MTVLDQRVGDLASRIPQTPVLTDPDVIERYRSDWARDPDAGRPLAVVRARCTADVQAVMRWAAAEHIPVIPRGAGSGLSGGATAVDGGVVLTLESMRDIDIDPGTRIAVVQPGLLNAESQAGSRRPRAVVPTGPVIV
ncbi:hypothetical protein MAGR_20950 [Mycolicibacterium agri]|uniref:FAD-binding PCMH-type domain-containing protein n=1 Tax=Mycolicibacterium agri TaxID=36811 RepID=A0A7I9VYX5_MYCAG|nr:hypothetical protein MAGR_20950 [Mycolicibacterium agri]